MQDLTEGSIGRHLTHMALFICASMLIQTLYYLVDLYFVAELGEHALAGVGAAGTVAFLVLALTQVLGVGTVTLIAHAVGRKDQPDANLVFNQSLVLSGLCAAVVLLGGYLFGDAYMQTVSADRGTAIAGETYLHWFLPCLALQFAVVAMSSALRGTGIVKPAMTVQALTVLINIALAPVLIAGWGTGRPLGVAGAGLASSLAIVAGTVVLVGYFVRLEHYVRIDRALWRPRLDTWRRMLDIGLPAGGEFMLMFVIVGVVYWCVRDFGADAQAGFGIGTRVMQSIMLPAMAIAFAASPIAGQNFGARRAERVMQTYRSALRASLVVMLALTLLCQWRPQLLIGAFTDDAGVLAAGADYLRITSWNFVGLGIVFTCSGMFQAIGNTWPALVSSAGRVITFVVPAIWLSAQPWVKLEYFWYVSVTSVLLQAVLSWWLLNGEFRRRLAFAPLAPASR
ncbi:MAG TPA: MATE family efflux transporter [Steroidobacteraceae bacterium]|nr:MATE family efflux transporter [Steroidobacteraceae bacterium]